MPPDTEKHSKRALTDAAASRRRDVEELEEVDSRPIDRDESEPRRDEPGRRWMEAFQQGDADAFDRIVLTYQAPVQHFLYRFLRDRARAEDLTQEVFLRVFRCRDRYRPIAGFRTWLFTIASRLAMNEIRSLKRRRRVFSDVADGGDEDGDSVLSAAVDHREMSPPIHLEHKELEEVVSVLIQELPAKQRAAVLLSRMEELSHREIAEALQVTRMAVKSLVLRARETLRARLERYLQGQNLNRRNPKEEDSRDDGRQ